MRVLVLRHHEEDSPGLVGEVLEAGGADVTAHLFPDEGPFPPLDGVDYLVLLGATFSVYDAEKVGTWIGDKISWLREADSRGVPILGICFGAQAMAAAFGGAVEPSPRHELGWTVVSPIGSSSPAGRSAPSAPVPTVEAGPWFEYHGDRCVLPPKASLLAENDVCPQAFLLGRHLGVQFHPEVDRAQLAAWLEAGACAAVDEAGLDPAALFAETTAMEPAARERADRLVSGHLAWLRAEGATVTLDGSRRGS